MLRHDVLTKEKQDTRKTDRTEAECRNRYLAPEMISLGSLEIVQNGYRYPNKDWAGYPYWVK